MSSSSDILITGGDVLVRDGRIAAVGSVTEEQATGARRIDARGMVDTHRHVWQGALAGSTGNASLLGYVQRVVQGIAPGYTPEDVSVPGPPCRKTARTPESRRARTFTSVCSGLRTLCAQPAIMVTPLCRAWRAPHRVPA
ncbi:hypothetical protein ABZT03_42505 [Streptomyces sp. NPDC005574]|uniref:hypothetical protein n=1 Tax=Streptomyces sp. NPDC005574 TaxID=3156891 RepID=UPI0033A6E3AA